MQILTKGKINGPVVGIIGVWDPLLPIHIKLFHELVAYGQSNGLGTLLVVLDPDPGILLWGRSTWPVYDQIQMRLHLMMSCGIDAILNVHLAKKRSNYTPSTVL